MDIAIRDASIRLGQLLKLANLVSSGADVKAVLATEEVFVNNAVETRRGRTLYIGDVVTLGNASVTVTSKEK